MKQRSCLGHKFNRLLILGQWVYKDHSCVLAQCDCGNLKEYQLGNLKNGHTKSCGCVRRESVQLFKPTHGKSQCSVYYIWRNLVDRCIKVASLYYKNYGGRGIKICDRWLKFENFYEDMGNPPKGLQLDRIDNNKGYYKENCRWVTSKVNNQNRRNSKYWFINGVRYSCARTASEELGVSSSTIINWCNGQSLIKAGVQYSYPPKPGCYSELKYKEVV